MPKSMRWILAFSGISISAAAFSFWNWAHGMAPSAAAGDAWFTQDAFRYFWIPFFTGAGLTLTAWRS